MIGLSETIETLKKVTVKVNFDVFSKVNSVPQRNKVFLKKKKIGASTC